MCMFMDEDYHEKRYSKFLGVGGGGVGLVIGGLDVWIILDLCVHTVCVKYE